MRLPFDCTRCVPARRCCVDRRWRGALRVCVCVCVRARDCGGLAHEALIATQVAEVCGRRARPAGVRFCAGPSKMCRHES